VTTVVNDVAAEDEVVVVSVVVLQVAWAAVSASESAA
jgi:hypothetical protein